MKKYMILASVLLFISVCGYTLATPNNDYLNVAKSNTENQLTFYVSPDGSDTAASGINSPFATIERARDEIRNMKNEGRLQKSNITVFIRGGMYNVTGTTEFTQEDSGNEASCITYAAYPGRNTDFYGRAII